MKKNLTIATLGGHSALEIFSGAKKQGFKTLALLVKGRDKTYSKYFKNLCDEMLYLSSFNDLTQKNIVENINKLNCIFIPHRYVQVYCDQKKFENNFKIPVFGNRKLLKYEEREGRFNQYEILNKADILYPHQYKKAEDISSLCIIKVKEKNRNYERAFFFASSPKEYQENSNTLIKAGDITEEDLKNAVIEEYLVGVQVNFNFFYSVIKNRLELLGTDTRRQTNIDGIIRLPAAEQNEYLKYKKPTYIESGHIAVTVKESLLENAFEIAEKILIAAKKISPPGIIGPFGLQTVIISGPPKEKIITFDLSLRMPGSPGTGFTPYSGYLFGSSMTFGERIALEIKEALRLNKIAEIIS